MNPAGSACLVAVLAMPLAACSSPQAAPLPTVSISMFSGRPDPSFTLTREQTDALSACRRSGTAKPTRTFPDERLGFRFFDVIGLDAAPLLVGVEGAWLDQGGKPTPVELCPDGFSILRDAAVSALPPDVSGALPQA